MLHEITWADTGVTDQSEVIDYDLMGGAFLPGTRLHSASRRPTIRYSYVDLPSLQNAQKHKLKWQGPNLGIQIMDIGMAVHEHDLIAALTVSVLPSFSLLKRN